MQKPKLSSCSQCEIEQLKIKKKGSLIGRIHFWLFVIFGIMAAFLLWSAREEPIADAGGAFHSGYLAAIIAILLSLMFGIFCFMRFIRSRSIAGGLFLTMAISTGVVLGASQMINAAMQPMATLAGEGAGGAHQTIAGLAQVGLFALWFLLLLLTIYKQVGPVKKIDKVLTDIVEGKPTKRVKLGKSKQYIMLAEKLEILSQQHNERIQKNEQKKRTAQKRRVKQQEIADDLKIKQLQIDTRFN